MFIQVHAGHSQEPLALCSNADEIDQVFEQHKVSRAQILLGLQFPLDARVTRAQEGREVVHLKIGPLLKSFERLCGSDVDPAKLAVSCTSRGGDVVPVRSIILSFRGHDDQLTDRGTVWVHGGDEAVAHLTIFPQNITAAGLKSSDIVGEAVMEIVERLLFPFVKI